MLPTQSYGPNTTVPVKVLGNAYLLRKILKDDAKGQVIRGLYFKRSGWIGRCVLKEGKRGVLLDEHGRDMYARIQWQQELHENMEQVLPLPKLINCFEEAGSLYLVLEYIAGRTLLTTVQEQRKNLHWQYQPTIVQQRLLSYFLQVANAIRCMHQKGYIHRDITGTNFLVTSRERVILVDLELAYSWRFNDPTPAFALGTYGFMSPAQAGQQDPVPEDDVYSLGALLVLITTGFEPLRIIEENHTALQEKLAFIMGDPTLAQIAVQCLQADADQRPTLDNLIKQVEEHRHHLGKQVLPAKGKHTHTWPKEMLPVIIQKGLQGILCSQTMAKDGLWFSPDTAATEKEGTNPVPKVVYGGFSRGLSGILYMLGKAKQAGFSIVDEPGMIDQAMVFLQQHFLSRPGIAPGLHFGKAGAAVGMAAVWGTRLTTASSMQLPTLLNCLADPSSWLSLAHGAAGQAMAVLLCQQFMTESRMEPQLRSYIDLLLDQQQKDGAWLIPIHDQGVIRGVKHLSYAYGNAGILWVLLEYYRLYQYTPAGEAAMKGLAWLRQRKTPQPQHYSWCDGGPGIALAFIKASAVLKDRTYKAKAENLLATVPDGITLPNLSSCHGLTGLGEVYLDAFETWGDDCWLQKATWIANVLLHLKKTPNAHQHYWLVENRDYPTADLLVGNGGVIHFLIRYFLQGRLGQMRIPASIL